MCKISVIPSTDKTRPESLGIMMHTNQESGQPLASLVGNEWCESLCVHSRFNWHKHGAL